jgi:hypothetical protein
LNSVSSSSAFHPSQRMPLSRNHAACFFR